MSGHSTDGIEQHRGLLDVQYGCHDCDWPPGEGSGKNGVGLAAQHARKTGHNVWAEEVWSREWNRSQGTDTDHSRGDA